MRKIKADCACADAPSRGIFPHSCDGFMEGCPRSWYPVVAGFVAWLGAHGAFACGECIVDQVIRAFCMINCQIWASNPIRSHISVSGRCRDGISAGSHSPNICKPFYKSCVRPWLL